MGEMDCKMKDSDSGTGVGLVWELFHEAQNETNL